MRIGGLDQSGNVYESYSLDLIPKVDIETLKQPVVEENVLPSYPSPKPQPIDYQNISLDFRVWKEFDFVGKDSNVQSLDVQNAISDMKKDVVLQEYQYFVGQKKN